MKKKNTPRSNIVDGILLLLLLFFALSAFNSQDYRVVVKTDKNQIEGDESFIIGTSINFSKPINQTNITYILPDGWEQKDSSGQNCSKIVSAPTVTHDLCNITPKNAKPASYNITIKIAAANIRPYWHTISIEVV